MILSVVAGLVVVAVVAFLLVECEDETNAACVIAVDAQGSSSPMTQVYQEWLPELAEHCAAEERARLSIALISGETRTGTVTPVTTDLRTLKDLKGNANHDAKIIEAEIARVIDEANPRILAAPEQHGGTDILGTLCVAHDLLKGREKTTLIILSDAINNRAPYVLTEAALDAESIDRYVSELGESGQLCDLTGTRVEMHGVGIGWDTGGMSSEQLAGVQRFWTAVITATGAELVAYQRNP